MKKNEQIYADFTDRINFVCEKYGSVARLANETDISVTSINKYRNGLSDPSRSNLIALADAAQIDVAWLATGVGSASIEQNKVEPLFNVPALNITASANLGFAVYEDREIKNISFDKSWLRITYNINPETLFTMSVMGESMEPSLHAGELILVSNDEELKKPNDGIYAIRLEGDILVKRIQRLPQNRILISSDNKAYTPYEITLNNGTDFNIIGKVLLVHGLRRI